MATELKTFRFDSNVLQRFKEISKRRGDLSFHVNEAMRVYRPAQEAKSKAVAPPQFDPKDLEFSIWMLSLITDTHPDFKKPNLESWAKTVRLMREKENRTHHEMGVLWKWARLDSFWQGNILSASKFRDKYDQLSMQMSSKGKTGGRQSLSQRSATATERALAEIEMGGDLLGSHDETLRLQMDK